MPLLDHFRGPLSRRRQWQSFLGAWATTITSELNLHQLPVGCYAEASFEIGLELTSYEPDIGESRSGWEPPEPSACIPFAVKTDMAEIRIYDEGSGYFDASAAIKLVSPQNKYYPTGRDAFLARCEGHLHNKAGVIRVDIVTEPIWRMHDSFMGRLGETLIPQSGDLVAAAYGPIGHDDATRLDLWVEPVTVGAKLPTLPLCFKGGLCIPIDLEATYQQTRRMLRIGDDWD